MNTKTNKIDIRTVAKAGFLVALSVVITRFIYIMLPIGGVSGLRITFGELPIMISGFLFGPIIGGLTGAAADLIGVLINPMGPYFPGFTFSSAMWGVIPGLVMIAFNQGRVFTLTKVMISMILSYIIISLGLNTLWISMLYGSSFIVLLPARLLNVAISIPVMILAVNLLLKRLKSL